jgi:RecJ-like exonuclease
MTHFYKKQCPECKGSGQTGDKAHEIFTCQTCEGEGEIKIEMDDLNEIQTELMDLGFERHEATNTRFYIKAADGYIQIDFNKAGDKVQMKFSTICPDVNVYDLIERVNALYFGVTGEELTTNK